MSGSRSAAVVLCVAVLVAVVTPGVLRIGTAARVAVLLALAGGALYLQGKQLTALESLQGTGSLTHRVAAWDAAVRLLDRPVVQTVLGSGTGSLDDLFAAGFLQLDGFKAVDNQLVATFAVAGVVGLAALVGLFVVGVFRGDPAVRPAALLMIGMTMSFDLLEWNATAVLLIALATLGSAVRPARAVPEAPAAEAVVRSRPGPLVPVGAA
jgi:hypothetical protein